MPKGGPTLSRSTASALSRSAPRRWTSLSEAVEQTGGLDSLLPRLRDGSIAARHGGLYVNGRISSLAGSTDASWWDHVHVFNVAADRVVFVFDWHEATAIEVEVERPPLTRFPPVRAPRRGGGAHMIGPAQSDTSTPTSPNGGHSPNQSSWFGRLRPISPAQLKSPR